jgi:hypothetical protein
MASHPSVSGLISRLTTCLPLELLNLVRSANLIDRDLWVVVPLYQTFGIGGEAVCHVNGMLEDSLSEWNL